MSIRFLLPALAALSAAPADAADPKPNVLYILADDLGYGDLGCYGQTKIRTPHIDRLAAEGVRFTQAYAGATVCAPSRCCLMTGKHGGHAAIRGNRELKPEGQLPMPADTVTVAHLMKKAGYATGLVGKWGLGHPGSASTPDKMGFDHFFGYNCQRKAHEYYPEYLWRNGEKVMLDGKKYSHDLMADDALDFVRRHKGRPFFLYLAFTIPHSKLQVPDLGPYANERLAGQPQNAGRHDHPDGPGRRPADGALKELKIDDRTLVVFASDNGAAYRDAVFNHSGPLRGYKRDLYEGGIRTPAIARWPGRIKPGAVSDQVWAFWDVLPTLAELVGQKPPPGLDGVSVLPALLDGKPVEHPPLYWEFHERGFDQAARIGDWKAVRNGKERTDRTVRPGGRPGREAGRGRRAPGRGEAVRGVPQDRPGGLGKLADPRHAEEGTEEEGQEVKASRDPSRRDALRAAAAGLTAAPPRSRQTGPPASRPGGGRSSRISNGSPGRTAGSPGTGQPESHLTPTFAAVGCYRLLGEPVAGPAKAAAFVRAGHPFRLKKLERDLRVFEFQQIQALLWLGEDASAFRDRVRGWTAAGRVPEAVREERPPGLPQRADGVRLPGTARPAA